MHDRSNILLLHTAGDGIRKIARDEGISRNSVRRAVAPDARSQYYRPSAIEDIEPAVRDVLADFPHMSVSDISMVVDWRKSRRHLSDLVATLRPEYIERSESEATGAADIQALPMESLKAGALDGATIRTIGAVTAETLETMEVDWWTELANATRV